MKPSKGKWTVARYTITCARCADTIEHGRVLYQSDGRDYCELCGKKMANWKREARAERNYRYGCQ